MEKRILNILQSHTSKVGLKQEDMINSKSFISVVADLISLFEEEGRVPFSRDIDAFDIFKAIERVTGHTMLQIKEKVKTENIAFSRQLFCYFFITLELGDTVACSKIISRDRNTPRYSVTSVQATIEFDKGWRKYVYLKVRQELLNIKK